jgi:hypothetical protein
MQQQLGTQVPPALQPLQPPPQQVSAQPASIADLDSQQLHSLLAQGYSIAQILEAQRQLNAMNAAAAAVSQPPQQQPGAAFDGQQQWGQSSAQQLLQPQQQQAGWPGQLAPGGAVQQQQQQQARLPAASSNGSLHESPRARTGGSTTPQAGAQPAGSPLHPDASRPVSAAGQDPTAAAAPGEQPAAPRSQAATPATNGAPPSDDQQQQVPPEAISISSLAYLLGMDPAAAAGLPSDVLSAAKEAIMTGLRDGTMTTLRAEDEVGAGAGLGGGGLRWVGRAWCPRAPLADSTVPLGSCGLFCWALGSNPLAPLLPRRWRWWPPLTCQRQRRWRARIWGTRRPAAPPASCWSTWTRPRAPSTCGWATPPPSSAASCCALCLTRWAAALARQCTAPPARPLGPLRSSALLPWP